MTVVQKGYMKIGTNFFIKNRIFVFLSLFFLITQSMTKSTQLLNQNNVDIETARSKANFSVGAMTQVLRGGQDAVAKLNSTRELMAKEPLFDKSKLPFLNRQEVKKSHATLNTFINTFC